MASAYLQRTSSSTGNRKTWTFSTWFKKSNAGTATGYLFSSYADTNNRIEIGVEAGTYGILFKEINSGATSIDLTATPNLRDPSGWYHLVIKVDTTQATASDRIKVYINGSQITVWQDETYPSQNYDTYMNVTGRNYVIGQQGDSTDYFDGLITHTHLTDGNAYDASTFGETDSTSGIWKPKTSPSVTYGTNGFFLKMENSGAMGTDSSGNTNTFSTSGTLTQTEDTPSNNFATLNPLNVPTSNAPSFSNGNNTVVTANGTGAYFGATSSLGVSSGKWYTEFKISNATADAMIGITFDPALDARNNDYSGRTDASGWSYFSSGGDIYNNGSTAYGNGFTTGDIIGVAMDLDNAKLYFSKNGTFQNSGDPTSGATGTGAISITSGETYFFSCGDGSGTSASTIQANFGNGRFGTTALASSNSDSAGLGLFEYSVPSGYYALCTKNIKNYG